MVQNPRPKRALTKKSTLQKSYSSKAMEAASLAFSVAQTLLTALQVPELKEVFSICSYESRLKQLTDTVTCISAVLQDAERKEKLSQQELDYFGKLKGALYDADDLLDEFITRKKQQQQIQDSSQGQVSGLASSVEKLNLAGRMSREIEKISEKLGGIASDVANFNFECDDIQPSRRLNLAGQMSREIEKISEKLDGIASDADKFGFKGDYIQPIRRERKETCSYVHVETVIGREVDKRKFVDMLLDANANGFVPVLSIVGMGGLGKTTLAQLVFNDKKIEKEFPMRLWVCVSDQYPNKWNVKSILANILRATNEKVGDKSLVLEQVVQKLRKKLEGSKYLLVLDDVWIENHGKWQDLEEKLSGLGQRGSRIVVTTRSKKAATAVGSKVPYELKGLSEENSWRLFEATVGRGQPIPPDLLDIGKDILKRCANVPLAIKVIGGLLYGEGKSKWEYFQRCTLSEIREGEDAEENDVLAILMFSYHNLSSPLKGCFSYCAVFPKDFVIKKSMLIGLWMAQGYLKEPRDRSMEDVGEEYFQILLQRCFFQEIEKDEYDEILSCKMHDLMHDVAQKAAGKEVVVADSISGSLDQEVQIRHMYFEGNPSDCADSFISSEAQIRTYIQGGRLWMFQFPLSMLLMKWMKLRALHLRNTKLESLPNDIGKLVHLRYLHISWTRLEILPKSITRLVNLQTLNLSRTGLKSLPNDIGKLVHLRYLDISWCDFLEILPKSITRLVNLQTLLLDYLGKLKELPRDLNRLAKLRVLGLSECQSLKYMPDGMKRMTCLNTLPLFVVAKRDSSINHDGVDELEDLRALRNLKGSLKIRIDMKYAYNKELIGGGGGYISNKEYLKDIDIEWFGDDEGEGVDSAEELLEDLQPHRNLKAFEVSRYPGTKIPRWAMNNSLTTSLPNLVKILIYACNGLQSLPWLGELQFLNSLWVSSLDNLEYMEDRRIRGSGSSSSSRAEGGVLLQPSSFFPSLELLELDECPNLKGWWRGLSASGLVMEDDDMMGGESSIITVGGHRLPSFPRLSTLKIYGCSNLTVIPLCPTVETLELESFNERLRIMIKKEEEQRGERGSNDSGNSSHDPKMRVLRTDNARHLESLPVVAFQCPVKLRILDDSKVESLSEIEEAFRSCSSSLQSLLIGGCEKLRSVSGGLQHLTALESLELINLRELRFDETQGQGVGEEEDHRGVPWRRLAQSLCSLTLWSLPKVDDLPKGMCYLTALQSLEIVNLPLKDLPEWIGCLSSLQSLKIRHCKYLKSLPEALQKLTSLQEFRLRRCNEIIKRRCESPDGEDWPKIQHIPYIRIK